MSEKKTKSSKPSKPKPAAVPQPAARETLVKELNALRSTVKDIFQRCHLRLDSQVIALIKRCPANTSLSLSPKQIKETLKRIERLKLKPKKGRLKDLTAVFEVMKKLSEKLPEIQES